jgi:hypothetical protein
MEKIVFLLNKNTDLTDAEKKFINELNQVLLMYNDLKDNLFKKNEKILDFEFIREWFDYSSNANCLQFEFTNDLEIKNELLFNINNKIISVYNTPKFISMEVDDFHDFIKENNISTIFMETTLNDYTQLFLEESSNCFYYDEDEQIINSILQKYITCYNDILKKLSPDALTTKKYFCLFNSFAFGCIEKRYSYFIDKNYILSAIAIMCKEEINERLAAFERIQEQKERENEERLQQEKRERSQQTGIKIRQLEEKILNDEKFTICRSEKERGTYLRGMLEEECYDVITYLEMERMSTGKVRAKGIKWKQFINRLWETLNCKA